MKAAGEQMKLKFPAAAIGIMLLLQLGLGMSIIWTGRHPEVATAHQTLGAILLATTALLYFRIVRLTFASRQGHEAVASAQHDSRNIRSLPATAQMGAVT